MGFMDELRKLTQPYEDEDDFYEGADPSVQPAAPTEAQLEFENTFGAREAPEPADEEPDSPPPAPQEGSGKSIFSALGRKKPAKPRMARERTVEFGGTEADIDKLAHTACYGNGRDGKLRGFVEVDEDAVKEIYRRML